MGEPLVLTYDVGTQSMRGMLVDKNGEIVAMHQSKYAEPYYSKQPNWAEQKPDFYFDMLCTTTQALKNKSGELFNDVFAVAMTVFRDTPMFLDKDKRPLRDIIIWLDQREAKNSDPVRGPMKAVLSAVGMKEVIVALHKKSVVNWVKENEPEVWNNTAHCVMLPTYLNYKLTGVLKDSASNQIGHFPVDYKNRTWAKKSDFSRFACDIPNDRLCDLCEAGDTIGAITAEVSKLTGIPEGMPLIATGSDKGCETLGLSVIHRNQASLSFGTTATIQFATDTYFEPQPFLPAYPAIIPTQYNPEIQIYRGFWMISWFKKEFAEREMVEAEAAGISPEQLLNRRLAEIPPGCNGLMLQPFWSPGVGSPEAKGAIIGFSDVHTRIHVYRAIIEGIGFTLIEGLRGMEKRSGQKIEELFVGGGGSQSDEICQITADMFGLPVKRIQTHEACGLGAAMVAFVANKTFKSYDEAIASMIRVKDVFTPDSETHKLYENIYEEVYSKIYPRLKPLYKKQRELLR